MTWKSRRSSAAAAVLGMTLVLTTTSGPVVAQSEIGNGSVRGTTRGNQTPSSGATSSTQPAATPPAGQAEVPGTPTAPTAPNENTPASPSTANGLINGLPGNAPPGIGQPRNLPPGTQSPMPPVPQSLPAAVEGKSNQLNLSARSTIEVANDVMTVTYSTLKEGTDAQAVQAALKQALDIALDEARKAAKPGQIEVETGNFSLSPRYTPPGWQGRAELVTTGKDQAGIARLAGRIQTMSVTRVMHSLSREAREKAEAEATSQAVAKFRQRASEVTRLFGFSDFVIREISVTTSESSGEVPMVRARMNSAATVPEVALPAEGGRGQVTVVVGGGVEMR